MSDGRRFRILCVADDFSRECLTWVVDTSLSGVRVVRELERLTDQRAMREVIVSDHNSELTSLAVLQWVPGRVAGIRARKPTPRRVWNKLPATVAEASA